MITSAFHNTNSLTSDLTPNPIQIIPDPNHCLTSDTYKIFHPDTILTQVNIFRDKSRCLVRYTIKDHYFDMVPRTYINKSKDLCSSS